MGMVQGLSGHGIIFWSADNVGRKCGLQSAFGRIRFGDFVVAVELWTVITVGIEGARIPEPRSRYLSLCLFFFLLFTFPAFELFTGQEREVFFRNK